MILLPPFSGKMKRRYIYTILHYVTSQNTSLYTNVLITVWYHMFMLLGANLSNVGVV